MDLDNVLSGNFRRLEGGLWSDVPLWIPTGAVSLDYAIGGFSGRRGGIPLGKVSIISGDVSSGKSSLLDHVMRNMLNLGGIVILGDPEDSHGESRMREIGIGKDAQFLVMDPPENADELDEFPQLCLEDFFVVMDDSLRKIRKEDPDVPVLYALDSLASIDMRENLIAGGGFEKRDKMNEEQMRTKYLSQKLRSMDAYLSRANAALVIVNQLREKPGVSFGDPRYEPGGKAVMFHSALLVRLNGGSFITAKDDPTRKHKIDKDAVGISCNFFIKKNKVGRPHAKGTFPLYYDERGILHAECLVDLIEDREKHKDDDTPLSKEGNTYLWYGEKMGVRKKFIQTLCERPDLATEIEEELFLNQESTEGE